MYCGDMAGRTEGWRPKAKKDALDTDRYMLSLSLAQERDMTTYSMDHYPTLQEICPERWLTGALCLDCCVVC